MIKIDLQMFGGRGGGSGGGDGVGAGHNTGNGKKEEKTEGEKTEQASTGPVTSLKKGEKYDVYKVKDGKEKTYDDDMTYEDTKDLLRGYHPDKNGIWKDRNGRTYRVVRSKR